MCGGANNIIAMAIYFAIVRCGASHFAWNCSCSTVEIYAN